MTWVLSRFVMAAGAAREIYTRLDDTTMSKQGAHFLVLEIESESIRFI